MTIKLLKKILIPTILLVVFTFTSNPLLSKDIPFILVEIEKISRYTEDRLMFQHVQHQISPNIDNSISSLLIIKDKKVYHFKDGYDNPDLIVDTKNELEYENKLIPDLWQNKVDDEPDFIRVTERRREVMRNVSKEFVNKNFGEFYKKVRNNFIQTHVNIFRNLMVNRKDDGIVVERKPVPKRLYDKGRTKFAITVSAKTIDEKIYYAEDLDGNGICETFTVSIPDGFQWGFKSGPNIIMIYKNKSKEIEQIIGNLTQDAYYGTTLEAEKIKKNFPKPEDITDMIDDIYQFKYKK